MKSNISPQPRSISVVLWKKLGEQGRSIYTDIVNSCSQDEINPDGHRLPSTEWETVKHNFAVLAALCAVEFTKKHS